MRRVKPASAEASLLPCDPGQIVIEHDQQLMETNVVDKLIVQPFSVHSYPHTHMATKTGRNDPCPCGSGKKYKQCCLRKEEEAEHEALAALSQAREKDRAGFVKSLDQFAAQYEDDVALTEASNAAVDLVHAGKLDEAEQAARDLLVHFPDVHDGYDRLGMVYQARGDNKQAAHYYRQALEFIRQHPTQYEENDRELQAVFARLIDKLDPPAP
jgi:tetratricopeptide (TPR) repeat protein